MSSDIRAPFVCPTELLGQALDLDVWVDRGRPVRRRPGLRMDGETQVVETTGEWFRLFMPPRQQGETPGERPNRDVVAESAQISASLFDSTGALVDVHEADRVEIQRGPGEWQDAGLWEVQQVMRPRDGQGNYLLLVLQVMKTEDH